MERRAIEELITRWLNQAIASGNVEIFDELLTADVTDRTNAVPSYGTHSFKQRARAVHAAFSEIVPTLEQLIVEGPHVAWRWRIVGTHRGSFAGVAATGRRVSLSGVNFQRAEAGRIAEHWTLVDTAGLLHALQAR